MLNYRFTTTGMEFEGGSTVDVDLVIAATGYSHKYAYIECSEIKGMVLTIFVSALSSDRHHE